MECGTMNKVKIRVLKTTLGKELSDVYGTEGLTACPMLQVGQGGYADYAKHNGFCDESCKTNSIKHNFLMLAHEYLFVFRK